ncbi:MAG: 2-isopropylmalate synthase [Pseudomonadales bacterium]|jgi:2-isopropylmalate synthase|nr:2-isopropylmalate synthase [Pseudomonadales bacterium]
MSRSSYRFERAAGRAGAMPHHKYRPFAPVHLPDRTWPDRVLETAPRWCSVDLRDGNQALIDPMRPEEKLRFWNLLLSLGFEEIEVGFPAASQTDFDFVRKIVEEDRIPDNVTIQILCQAREELIARSVDALAGAKRAIFHLYNSTSTLQRRVVFGMDRDEITALALRGVEWVKREVERIPETEVILQYSPESFTGTELEFAVEVCSAVARAWGVGPDRKMIVNLPATVEMSTPNVYADQIEWFCRNFPEREHAIVSLHTHNDRGTGIAATELGVLAGAERVEGTLFGNGERTGNADLVTLAMNLFSQGVDPQLDLSDMRHVRSVVEACNKLPVHERHPYAGDLVFTAFSGSHQDAIRKGMTQVDPDRWEVPYLPIDPADVGGHYRETVRVNSQSGKGGVAFVLENHFELSLPRTLLLEFARVVQEVADRDGGELTAADLRRVFDATYLDVQGPYRLVRYHLDEVTLEDGSEGTRCDAVLEVSGKEIETSGEGTGPVAAFVHAVERAINERFAVEHFHEQSEESGSAASALCIVGLKDPDGGLVWGAGASRNTVTASFDAVLSALNRRWAGV